MMGVIRSRIRSVSGNWFKCLSWTRGVMCLGLALFAFTGYAQQTGRQSFSAAYQNVPITTALAEFRDKYGIKIAYDDQALAGIQVNSSFENLSLDLAMQELLSETTLVYRVMGKDKVLIRPKSLAEVAAEESAVGKVSGKVLDPYTGEGLAYATVTTLDGKRGTIADEWGEFSFDLARGEQELRVQYLGYEAKDIKVDKSAGPVLVKLRARPQEIPSVTIVEQHPILTLDQADGSTRLFAGTFSRLPTFVAGPDVLRNLQLLPGIAAQDDLSAELKIRGGEADENMIILDGIQLHKVDHYFGVFSAINGSVVEEVRLYKNTYPVEFGGKLSGLLDMRTKAGLGELAGGEIGLDLLASNLTLQMPMGKNASLVLAGRMTNNNLGNYKILNLLQQEEQQSPVQQLNSISTITRNNIVAIEPDFRFYDLNAKWSWQAHPNTRFTASYFRGYDEINFDYAKDFRNRIGQTFVSNEETNQEISSWENHGASFQWEQAWSPKLETHLNLSASEYGEEIGISRLLRQSRLRTGELLKERLQSKTTENSIQTLSLNWNANYAFSLEQQLQLGYQLNQDQVAFGISAENGSLLARSNTGLQNAAYAEYVWKMPWNLRIQGGLRLTHYDLTQDFYWSPRVDLQYDLSKNASLKTSWGINQQFTREIYHEDRFGRTFEFLSLAADEGIPVASSEQFMIGTNIRRNGWELDIEMYRKYTDGMIEHALVSNGRERLDRPTRRTEFRLFKGDRLTRGIDFLLKKTTADYQGWVAYTLSKTTLSFPAIAQGTPFPSQDDRRHQLKWVNQYRYKDWDFSLSYIFSSGTPYTDISLLDDLSRDRTTIRPEERISYLEDYHRVDISASYNFLLGGRKARVGVSIFNLFDRQNVKQRQYIFSIAETRADNVPTFNTVVGMELQLLDFTPNISFSYAF
ncbi:MAG: TonB-dependent receptor [Saprospiraceae bacterium]|nr:TonB-dependent receptor [Saprospiraceae bacterium]